MAKNDLIVQIAGDARKFKNATAGVNSSMRGMQSTTSKVAGAMKLSFSGVVASLGPLAAAFAAFQGIKKSIGLAAEFESTKAAIGTLLGDMDQAAKLLGDIEQFSASTPFGMDELSDAARGLLAFGRTQQDVMGDLQVLGDIAAATNKPIKDFVDIFGKVRSSGRATMEEINRLAERGVPIYAALARSLGIAEGEVREMVSTGKVGFKELNAALRSTTAEGGKFAGGMVKQSQTLLGKWSTFKDNFALILKDIGGAVIEAFGFKDLLDDGTKFHQKFRNKWMPEIKESLAEIGEAFRSDLKPALAELIALAPTLIKAFSKIATEVSSALVLLTDFSEGISRAAFKAAMFVKGSDLTFDEAKDLQKNFALEQEADRVIADVDKVISKQQRERYELLKQEAEALAKFNAAKKALKETDKDFKIDIQLPDREKMKPVEVGVQAADLTPAANQSLEVGTQAAFEKIFSAIGGTKDKKKPENKTAENTEKLVKETQQLRRLWERLERVLGKDKVVELIG